MSESDNKRVARNTLYLYIRMAVMMIVRLYTVRVVLEALGVEDYGLWQVITAFITAFTFIAPTITTSAQRYLNFDMGKGGANLVKIFSISFFFFAAVAAAVFLVLESFGLWFLNTRMTVPPDMVGQANWVFQCMVLTLVVDMLRMPYESAIIASEKMSFYAWVCILEAIVLLGIVFLLPLVGPDIRFASYGVLTLLAQTLICLTYVVYTRRVCSFARLHRTSDRSLMRAMAGFSGWNILGAGANAFAVQGASVLINLYFGLDVNAAYGICLQVHSAIFALVLNISKASGPRIVKDYSEGRTSEMMSLINSVGKITFLLVFMLMLPAAFNIDEILNLWLAGKVPGDAAPFSILTMGQLAVICFAPPLESAIFAHGNIRNYQIIIGVLVLLNFLLTLLLFADGLPAVATLWVKIALEVCIFSSRLWFMKRLLHISPGAYLRGAVIPSLSVAAIAVVVMWGIWSLTASVDALPRMFISSLTFLPLYLAVVYALGLSRSQRAALNTRLLHR